MPLPQLEHRLAAGNIVATVAVDEDQSAKTMLNEVIGQSDQQVEIHPWSCGKRAGKIEVMIGISEPRQRSKQYAVGEWFTGTTNDLSEQKAVREKRKVMSMLLERRDGKHHGSVFGKCSDGGPGEFSQIHEESV